MSFAALIHMAIAYIAGPRPAAPPRASKRAR